MKTPPAPASLERPAMHEPLAELVPLDRVTPQLTVRAVLTGVALGGLLSLCNVYSGLKIGWSSNMSITAALLSFAFWEGMRRAGRTRPWTLLENTVNQTAASSGASISSSGLVAAIPALAVMSGGNLTWPVLVVWTACVSFVGIFVAIGLRQQMLIVDRLPFPMGVAAAETMREMYAKGSEALARVRYLAAGALAAAAVKVATEVAKVSTFAVPVSWPVRPGGALAASGISSLSLKNLTFALDPSLLMVGVGVISGPRASRSVFLGSLIALGVLAPWGLEQGYIDAGKSDLEASWFTPLVKWLLWPGVAMMVSASLTSFAFSWRSIAAVFLGLLKGKDGVVVAAEDLLLVPKRWIAVGFALALGLAVFCQAAFFDIPVWAGAVGVALTFVLAIVAGRVSGETGITPIGAMGKVTQLLFGVLTPGNAAANLMAANVTGGAASQCADLLHDLKSGQLLGASPRFQLIAQLFGVLAGATVGSAAYLVLIPDPAKQLFTDEWPAPAVATWMAVAELFQTGIAAMPVGSVEGMLVGGVAGFVLALLEKLLPPRVAALLPSPASMGLGFVVPAYNALSMLVGGLGGALLRRWVPSWSGRFLIVVGAGLIAGDSLMGVGIAIWKILVD
jgi:putative OPT family oligopeptide transporter